MIPAFGGRNDSLQSSLTELFYSQNFPTLRMQRWVSFLEPRQITLWIDGRDLAQRFALKAIRCP